jgi:hypothetical protein
MPYGLALEPGQTRKLYHRVNSLMLHCLQHFLPTFWLLALLLLTLTSNTQDFSNLSADFHNPERANLGEQ